MRTELEELGLLAARQVAGEDAVEDVEVTEGHDSWSRPTYDFTFLIDKDRSRERLGLVRARVIQKLLDELTARGDENLPTLKLLDRVDWDKRARA